MSDTSEDEGPAPKGSGARQRKTRTAPDAPQNNADAPGASVVPDTAPDTAPDAAAETPTPKRDRRKRASYTPEELAAQPVGTAAHGGGIGAKLTKEERDEIRRNIRNAKKRDERKRRAKEKARRKKGTRKGTAGDDYVKEDEQPGAPAWEPTEAEKEQIMAYAGFGMSIDETSMLLGISEQTFHAHLTLVEGFRAHGLAIAKSRVRQSVYQQAVNGSLGHARFFEERVLGYQPNQRMEVTGAGGGPVETKTNAYLSDDDLLARLRTMADKQASVVARSAGIDLPHEYREDRAEEASVSASDATQDGDEG